MSNIETYAIVSISSDFLSSKDIRVSRDIPIKDIIYSLAQALNVDVYSFQGGLSVKAVNKGVLLSQNDTLREHGIFDGEILKIL